MTLYSGKYLVRGSKGSQEEEVDIQLLVGGDKNVHPVLCSDVSLSFWGGIDQETGVIIDQSHPLCGKSVKDTILCLPSGRGSCTASQVLLELILNKKAPRALILRDRDGLVCVGALIAQSVFPEAQVLDIIQADDFSKILETNPKYGTILPDGSFALGDSEEEIREVQSTTWQPLISSDPQTAISSSSQEVFDFTLSAEEQAMIDDSSCSEAETLAAECIIRYAHILSDAPTYISVEKAHIDGCTYIGPGGLNFVKRLVQEGGKVKIPTTLNAVSTDLRHWKRLGITKTPAQQAAIELAKGYLALECNERSFTCAPYLLDAAPCLNQQIVWGESNAVVFSNSVLGARTEKYADYLDICCAIVGKVPAAGVHLEENRKPTVMIDASNLTFDDSDEDVFSMLFPVLGHLCGTLSDGEVPILMGLERYAEAIHNDHMKAFCAAFGTTGSSPLIHVAGITPEATAASSISHFVANCTRTVVMRAEQLDETFGALNQNDRTQHEEGEEIQLIALGNPHLSLSECISLQKAIESMFPGHRKHEGVQIIACMSRVLYDQSPAIPALRKFGIEFVQDTCWCMLLEENGGSALIPSDPNATILTNSGKYAHYGPGLTGRNFRLGSMTDCLRAAVSGTLKRQQTGALPWKIKQARHYSNFNNYNHRFLRQGTESIWNGRPPVPSSLRMGQLLLRRAVFVG